MQNADLTSHFAISAIPSPQPWIIFTAWLKEVYLKEHKLSEMATLTEPQVSKNGD